MYVVLYDERAAEDLRGLRIYEARRILDEVDAELTHTPAMPSRRRKRLEGLVPPWEAVRQVWQLRVGELRVFYDVDEERNEVIVRAIRHKGRKTTEEIL